MQRYILLMRFLFYTTTPLSGTTLKTQETGRNVCIKHFGYKYGFFGFIYTLLRRFVAERAKLLPFGT